MDLRSIMEHLGRMGNPEDLDGMERFGIPRAGNLGVRVPELRRLARRIGIDSGLAEALWNLGYRETRLVASMVQDPKTLEEGRLEAWLKDFDSWEITDGTILNCFWKHPAAHRKALEWSRREREFEKRAGFVMMAILAVKDKGLPDFEFDPFLVAVAREAGDERNFVKKAISWALRQIGKRNALLNKAAIGVGEELKKSENRAARWIASDALRELQSTGVRKRVRVWKRV